MDKKSARRLVVYVGEQQRWHHQPLWKRIVEVCRQHGLAGATATKGLLGFGHAGVLHEGITPDAAPDLPVTIEAIDDPEVIERVLPELDLLVDEGLIAVHDLHVIKARPPRPRPPAPVPAQRPAAPGKAHMLRIHIGANDTWQGEPLHLALVKRCHQLDLAGATVYRGLEGYGTSGRVHRQSTFRAGGEPVTIVVIDTPERIAALLPYVDEMVPSGMAVLSEVEVLFHRAAANEPPHR